MTVFFSGSELIEIALGIEKNGLTFYQALSNKTQDVKTKDVYNYLTGEERKHLNTFQNMQNTIGQYQPPESYAGEYMLYLKALVDSHVFSNTKEAQEKAERTPNEIDAIDIGIEAEKDSILFYSELQTLVREPDHMVVLKIISEEKTHLKQLLELKEVLKQQRR